MISGSPIWATIRAPSDRMPLHDRELLRRENARLGEYLPRGVHLPDVVNAGRIRTLATSSRDSPAPGRSSPRARDPPRMPERVRHPSPRAWPPAAEGSCGGARGELPRVSRGASEPSSPCASAKRRSARTLRSNPQSIRSPKTRSLEFGRGVQSDEPKVAAASDGAMASRTEESSEPWPPGCVDERHRHHRKHHHREPSPPARAAGIARRSCGIEALRLVSVR